MLAYNPNLERIASGVLTLATLILIVTLIAVLA
jgi:hypothetical protein